MTRIKRRLEMSLLFFLSILLFSATEKCNKKDGTGRGSQTDFKVKKTQY
jgi:hypothetical protein